MPGIYIRFNPVGKVKVYNRNTRTISEIWQWRQYVSEAVLVSLLLILNIFSTSFWCVHCYFKLVNPGWEALPIWNRDLNLSAPTPQKGQRHPNRLSVSSHFLELVLKELNDNLYPSSFKWGSLCVSLKTAWISNTNNPLSSFERETKTNSVAFHLMAFWKW